MGRDECHFGPRRRARRAARSLPSTPRQLVELALRFGVTSEELLAGTGVEPAYLEEPDARVSAHTMGSLVRRALKLTGEPGLGFHHGLQLKLSSHGAVGMLAMTSATLRDAISAAERYVALRSPYLRLRPYVEDERAVVELVYELATTSSMRNFAVESLFTAVGQMTRAMLGRNFIGTFEVCFAGATLLSALRPPVAGHSALQSAAQPCAVSSRLARRVAAHGGRHHGEADGARV